MLVHFSIFASLQTISDKNEKMTLEGLRRELTEPQLRFLNLFWRHYVDTGQWPTTFEIHREYAPSDMAKILNPLSGSIVWENRSQNDNCYELRPIGILLTKDGTPYQDWVVKMIEFLRVISTLKCNCSCA
jgi:hypothetical protein